MRQALRQNPRRSQVANSDSIPAPLGGWNTLAPLANMDPSFATTLTNMIPRAGYCEARGGCILRNPGIVGDVETVMTWEGGNGSKMFAAAGTNIYEVTAPGTATLTTVVSATSAQWQSTNSGNDGGQFLIAVNGRDAGELFDGTVWAAFSISSLLTALTITSAQIDQIMSHMSRVWLAEKGSLRAWYTAIAAVQGACGLLDLTPVFTEGGYLTNMASWSITGGNGPQNLAVFMTNKGQIAIYQGTNPDDSNNWGLVGTAKIGRAPGRRSFTKVFCDLVVNSSDGALPLSQLVATNFNLPQKVAITLDISPSFSEVVGLYGDNFGWEAVNYSSGSLLIFNIPILELGTSVQFVQSQLTGGWCLFTGWNAFCFGQMNNQLFFGGHNGVFQADVGSIDVDQPIIAEVKPAFNYLGARGRQKQVTMIRPIMKLSANLYTRTAITVDVDFKNTIPLGVPTVPRSNAGVWDTGLWNEALWAAGDDIDYNWTGVAAIGYAVAPHLRFTISSTTKVTCQLIGFDILYQMGAPL